MLSNVQNPTYFLAPNWSFAPGGRIALGNIITNPLKPHLFLSQSPPVPVPSASSPTTSSTSTNVPSTDPAAPSTTTMDPATTPPTTTTRDHNRTLTLSSTRTFTFSLWTTFLSVITLGTSHTHTRLASGSYTLASVDTTTYTADPSASDLKTRCNDPAVRAYMHLDSALCKPVYLITGLKIARGFRYEATRGRENEVEVSAGGEVVPGVGLGGAVGGGRGKSVSDSFEREGDVVFAYQLAKISPKGWKGGVDRDLKVEEFQHRQAFLADGEGNGNGEEVVEGELGEVEREDLEGLNRAEVVEVDGVAVAYEVPKGRK